MNIKRILSSVLVAVMLFTSVIAVLPINAGAAYTDHTASATPNFDYKTYIDEVKAYSFKTVAEMFEYELASGALTGYTSGNFSIYINVYSGYVYYVNNVTGQILSSNPSNNAGATGANEKDRLASQIFVRFTETATGTNFEYASAKWAAAYGQIAVSRLDNGFRINYALGDTSNRFLLPAGFTSERFESEILGEMLKLYYGMIVDNCTEELINKYADKKYTNGRYEFNFYDGYKYGIYPVFDEYEVDGEIVKTVNVFALTSYLEGTKEMFGSLFNNKITNRENYNKALYDEFVAINAAIMSMTTIYTIQNPYATLAKMDDIRNNSGLSDKQKQDYIDNYTKQLEAMFKTNPATGSMTSSGEIIPGKIIYTLKDNPANNPYEKNYPTKARKYANMIQSYCPLYSFSDLYEDESESGCVMPVTAKPVIRCALDITINADGTLSVRLPSNSIMFDETKYTLEYVRVLEFFGAGLYDNGGYAFMPDGSGMITNYKDFPNAKYSRTLYGQDFAYQNIQADFNYFEPVTIPVYGTVNEVNANALTEALTGKSTVMNGYFAIVEEGSGSTTLHANCGGSTYKFAHTYASFSPYPQDTYDLSNSITVSAGSSSYTKVADSKYNGSYTVKYTMLTDPALQEVVSLHNASSESDIPLYLTNYVEMARCYRDYLEAKGELTLMENVADTLPLYIEALGTIEYIKKVLTFPVSSMLPLTKFEDVLTIYNELSSVKATFLAKADEYQAMADNAPEDDPELKENYLQKVEEYKALAAKYDGGDINNINFRLTGFSNEGIDGYYPAKVKWENALGGKTGFKELISSAASISATDGKSLGIYPDFDFMYIGRNKMFDGVGTRGYVARGIDNRYTRMRTYDPTNRMYSLGGKAVLSADVLGELFDKFEANYAKYDWKYVSLSTMGSTVNSNLDEENPIDRDRSLGYITEALASASDKGYSIMVDQGNYYTYKYIDHILNISIDSSQHTYCSYSVPFLAMIIHGYVNYAGSPINYSGSNDYDILRAIESGASLLYILCYDNTIKLKNDPDTTKYFSVNYEYLFEHIVSNYNELNGLIGNLQDYIIADHKVILAEKVVNSSDAKADLALVYDDYIRIVKELLVNKVNAAYDKMLMTGTAAGAGVTVSVDTAALAEQFKEIINNDSYDTTALKAELDALVLDVKGDFGHRDDAAVPGDVNYVSFDRVENYSDLTAYDFFTDSKGTDEDYDKTVYTATNNNVVMVTYRHPTTAHEVSFLLNFNIYAVNVRLADGSIVTLDRYEYKIL